MDGDRGATGGFHIDTIRRDGLVALHTSLGLSRRMVRSGESEDSGTPKRPGRKGNWEFTPLSYLLKA